MFTLPGEVNFILKKLNEHGYEAYIVGGCVRDFLLGKTPKDYDITTAAPPAEVKKIFPHTFDTGIKHGTVTAIVGKRPFEITTYRIDGKYKDHRHPESVVFTPDIEKDLMRRDFTMNAIAYHPKFGFADPYSGKKDIDEKIIRGVGNPAARFDEDALRVLRALRFSAVLGFDIEPETFLAVYEKAHLIKNISRERVRDELMKLISGSFPEKLPLLWETPLLCSIDPELCRDVSENKSIVDEIKAAKGSGLIPALLFFGSYKGNLKELLKGFRFDNKTISLLISANSILTKQPDFSVFGIKKLIYENGKDAVFLALGTAGAKGMENAAKALSLYSDIIRRGEAVSLKDLKISGRDIIEAGVPEGERVKEALESILFEVFRDPSLNERDILKNMAKEYLR